MDMSNMQEVTRLRQTEHQALRIQQLRELARLIEEPDTGRHVFVQVRGDYCAKHRGIVRHGAVVEQWHVCALGKAMVKSGAYHSSDLNSILASSMFPQLEHEDLGLVIKLNDDAYLSFGDIATALRTHADTLERQRG